MSVCGDNSCMFGSPGGMATNGGCRCLIGTDPAYRVSIRRRIYLLRDVAKAARKYVAAHAFMATRLQDAKYAKEYTQAAAALDDALMGLEKDRP